MEKKLKPRPILAEGEVTDHAHVLENPDIEVWDCENGRCEFELNDSTDLVHEEHGRITLSPNLNTSGIVREFNHFEAEIQNTKD